MREINLNGYIDDEMWYGDEITPATLHESLYGADGNNTDDVHIRLNSYGGSCNAAVRMFDDMRAYPGAVSITVSGTAASAATVLCMAADVLDMTQGSLFMIHDPSTIAYGNEKDMMDTIQVLRACKESILNMYERRARISRTDMSDLMTATTWMDANCACDRGFVDKIAEMPPKTPQNAAECPRTVDKGFAEEQVQKWFDRKRERMNAPRNAADAASAPAPKAEPEKETPKDEKANISAENRVKVREIDNRLEQLRF